MPKHQIIPIPSRFPEDHWKHGKFTYFRSKIEKGTKIHTIVSWKAELYKRIEQEIKDKKRIYSLREWKGQPFKSSLIQFKTLWQGVGFEKVYIEYPKVTFTQEYDSINFVKVVAKNEGLSVKDFWEWHGKANQIRCILHFTKFRYLDDEESI